MEQIKRLLRNFLATTVSIIFGIILSLCLIILPWLGFSFSIGYLFSVPFGEPVGVISGIFFGICFMAAFLHTFFDKFGKLLYKLIDGVWELTEKII